MKKILLKILTVLGLKRKKPKTRIGRILRHCKNTLNVALILYLLLLVYPQPLFAHTLEHEGIRLYSNQPIPKEAEALLSRIQSRIRASEIDQENGTFRLFLCNSKSIYTFLSPLSRHSFGNTAINGNIRLANVNLNNNTATAFSSDHNRRSFVGVASHEICHIMIRRKFGLWSAYRAPAWLNEGYCEYISGESSFPTDVGDELLSKRREVPGYSFKYFLYRRMVEFCLTQTDRNITELFSSHPSKENVIMETQEWISHKAPNSSVQSTPNRAPDWMTFGRRRESRRRNR